MVQLRSRRTLFGESLGTILSEMVIRRGAGAEDRLKTRAIDGSPYGTRENVLWSRRGPPSAQDFNPGRHGSRGRHCSRHPCQTGIPFAMAAHHAEPAAQGSRPGLRVCRPPGSPYAFCGGFLYPFGMRHPILLSWSGGKDSAFALHTLRSSPDFEPVGLLTSITEEYDRISIHGVRRELLERQ